MDFYINPNWVHYEPTWQGRMRVRLALWRLRHGGRAFNISTRKVGGLRFIKLGRFTFMFCLSREYRPLCKRS